jgi:hypothetical protein
MHFTNDYAICNLHMLPTQQVANSLACDAKI